MNFLDQLMPEERRLLVSLPYRVGLYIGKSDSSGGEGAEQAEMQALSNMITAYSQEIFGAETAQYIISETVSRKREWSEWSDELDTIEDECIRAVDLLSRVVDVKEVNAFKRCLMEVAESVALAFREYDETIPMMNKIKIYFLYAKSRAKAAKLGVVAKEWDQFINISLEEREALLGLSKALNVAYS